MARLALLLMLILGARWPLCAQAPVPAGQATSAVILSGTVQGSGGRLFADVTVTAKNQANSGEVSVKTNAAGEFRFSLRPGRYTITATPDAFPPAAKDVQLYSNQAITIRLSDAQPVPAPAPVPTGERPVPDGDNRHGTGTGPTPPGDVPIPATGAVAVSEVFSNFLDLASWLNGQAARNLRLQAIVSPTQGNQNLFVWIAHTGADQHIVIPANQISNPNDLQSVLKAYPQAALIGLAWVQHDRFLVLRSNP